MAGLKSLAKELQSKGRYGDTILAHINPQEAGILKALGGAGTINPDTGLPEYFIKKITRPIQQGFAAINPFNPGSALNKGINQIPIVGDVNKAANKLGTQIFQPVEKAIVQPVSRGLAEFDKAVGKTIPGGWGTVGQVALSAMGAPMPLQIGYGAARGSGVMRKGGNFNLQGAVIGGATAYATAELGEYMRGASDASIEAGKEAAQQSLTEAVAREAAPELLNTVEPITQLGNLPPPAPIVPNIDPGYLDVNPALPSVFNPPPPPSFLDTLATKAGDAMSGTAKFVTEIPTTGMSNAGETASGIKNLLGLGDVTAKQATAQAATTGVKALPMAGLAIYGETSLSALDKQREYLEEAKKAKAISDAEYQQALDSINRQRDYAADVVRQSPFNPNPSRDVSIGETFYGRTPGESNLYARTPSMLYAAGGSIDDELGMDSARGIDPGNMQKGLFGLGYSMGGTPRFLSGGGDGMSDSIPATINDKQPARLADGEFVIPADVVSHLGNGSSKAGAKQLYSMMDRIRTARTGNKKQGKQVNPRKYMPA